MGPVVAAVLLLCQLVGATVGRAVRPHIFVLLADDAGWNDFGFTRGLLAPAAGYNGPQALTPAIDALATAGIIFQSSYAYRYCSPSRAAFLTGRLPYHVHETNPGIPIRGCTNLNYTMIPAMLAPAGYTSYQLGKWHQGLEAMECVPQGRGFTHSFGYLSGATDHVDQTVAVCPSCTAAAKDQPTGFGCVDLWRDDRPAHGENGTYTGYTFTREAVSTIGQHDPTVPLFMYIAWQEVHGPYEVPSKFRELFPPDPVCRTTGDSPTCCGVTDSFASNVTDAHCLWRGGDGVCKCNGGVTGFQPKGLTCPPGGQCSREYMLGMLAALDSAIGNVTAAIKARGLYSNSIIVFSSDNGGATGGAPQHGSMNNFPLRGGKSAYFEGGVRAASFIHSPLLPASTAGSVKVGVISIADWYSTFAHLAGLDPTDHGRPIPGSMPAPFGTGSHPIDSVNLWPWLTGANSTAPRSQLVLGKLAGGAMIQAGWKIILSNQSPDWWYGPYSPNCSDGNGGHPHNCDQGCLFDLVADPTEHVNLKAAHPSKFAELKATLDAAVGVAHPDDPTGGDELNELGIYSALPLPADNAACQAMETTWGGFFGPFAGIAPPPPPPPPGPTPMHPPPPPPRRDCTWKNDTDYDVGGGGGLGPVRDAISKQECCAVCWADPECAVAVFSGAKAKGRCGRAPGPHCCWLKTKAELAKPMKDPGTVSCMPDRAV